MSLERKVVEIMATKRTVKRVVGSPKSVKATVKKVPAKATVKKEVKPVSKLASKVKANHHDQPPHLIIVARAGTGKTTTLVQGLNYMLGKKIPFKPSEQQIAIWDCLKLSKGASSICFCSFNKAIAAELQKRVPMGTNAMTLHSLGNRAVSNAFGRLQLASWRVMDIIATLMEADIKELRKTKFDFINNLDKLVGLCKMNLTGTSKKELEEIVSYYDLEFPNHDEAFQMVPDILEACKDVESDRKMDFNDMIWLPVALDLGVFKNDLLLVDEAQDLNKCQQALAKKAGKRLIFCGDPKQAIYGFAGADAESLPRLAKELSETPQGCIELPLTVTYRCGKAIVEEAQKYVPEYSAYERNPEGLISKESYRDLPCPKKGGLGHGSGCPTCSGTGVTSYRTIAKDGDMILARVNSVLISQCFQFIRQGRKANIQGRDIGAGLIRIIEKTKSSTVTELTEKLQKWFDTEIDKETAKKNPNENKLIMLQDKYDCLCLFVEDSLTVDEVINKIEKIFTDDETDGVMLSSVHKAKGLESSRVFLLTPPGAPMPHPMAKSKWQKEQEINLLYVAITRAIDELVFVQ